MMSVIYYSPEAAIRPERIFFDGLNYFERVHGLSGLGFLRKLFKKVKKIGKKAFRLVKKVVPIASLALTFVPGVGWVKAGVTVAEMVIDANKKKKKKKKKIVKVRNVRNRTPPTIANNTTPSIAHTQTTLVANRRYTLSDFIAINQAVSAENSMNTNNIINVSRAYGEKQKNSILNY